MNKVLKAAFAAFLVAGMSQSAHAQLIGDANTSVTGDTIYVEEDMVEYDQARHHGLNINGIAPADCTRCTDNKQCTNPARSSCSFGFCE